jgi:hypothetical protein
VLLLAATKCAFFVTKLKVKMLPTLIFFKDGVALGRLIGFEGLHTLAPGGGLSTTSGPVSASGTDFTTSSLLRLLKISGVLGDGAIERADSDSEGEEESMMAFAARRAHLMATEEEY